MKSRAGRPEKLVDFLTAAVQLAREELLRRAASRREQAQAQSQSQPPPVPPYSEEEVARISRAVGIGAVRYADLSTGRLADYSFSAARMLSFEGNTAPYLMYAHARASALCDKFEQQRTAEYQQQRRQPAVTLFHEAEAVLARHLIRFEEVT